MRKKALGYTEMEITTIGLGTWAMGGGDWAFGWGPQDDKESIDAIWRSLDLGINWIDTAPVYGFGRSEEVVGKALRGMSDKPLVFTKCALTWDSDGKISRFMSAESVRSEVEASLRRLDVEAIDLYQVHWPTADKESVEGWTAISDMVKEGKIRYAGVSNFSADQIELIRSIHPVASLQPPYSMLDRGVESDLLGYCAANDIGVIAYSPMQKGLLTGKFSEEQMKALADDDHRRDDPMFKGAELKKNLALVEELQRIAENRGGSVAQLAIAWVLRRPEVTGAIAGARNAVQIEETVPAGDWILSAEEIDEIEALLDSSRVCS